MRTYPSAHSIRHGRRPDQRRRREERLALRPINGPEKIARWLFAVIADNPTFEIRVATLNGDTAFIAYDDDVPDTVAFVESTDGLITELFLIRNPDKLGTVPCTRWTGTRRLSATQSQMEVP